MLAHAPATSGSLLKGGSPCVRTLSVVHWRQQQHTQRLVHCQSGKETGGQGPETPELGLGLKATWYAAEQFGNLIGLTKAKQGSQSSSQGQAAAISRADALAAIRRDYDINYFVSGQGDMEAYAEDCLFADPFAGFNGVDRFKRNVSNLGSLMEDIKLELTEWQEEPGQLVTKWRFSAVLGLPWRPVLAAAGGTTHVFDEATGKVVKHIESWDVEPGKVVRNLLKPSARMPSNQWEVLFAALYAGDARSVWFAVSGTVLKAALVAGGGDLLAHLVLGRGLTGFADVSLFALALVCLATEVAKFSGGMQGGDSGTGGRF